LENNCFSDLLLLGVIGLFLTFVAAILVKVFILDPARVRKMLEGGARQRGFEMIPRGSPKIAQLEKKLEAMYSGGEKCHVVASSSMERREGEERLVVSDLTIILKRSRSQMYNYHLNLFIEKRTGIWGKVHVRRKQADVLESLVSFASEKPVRVPDASSAFESRFVAYTGNHRDLDIITPQAQALLVEQFDKYPFPDRDNSSSSITLGREIFIRPEGIAISGPRSWKEEDLDALLEFGRKFVLAIQWDVESEESGGEETIRFDL
jgi:hypothetical protein